MMDEQNDMKELVKKFAEKWSGEIGNAYDEDEDEDSSPIDEEKKKEILSKFMNTQFPKIDPSPFIDPIRKSIDYQSAVRKTFIVEEIFICERCGMPEDHKGEHAEDKSLCDSMMAKKIIED